MSERILGAQGSPRRRRFLWVPMLLIAAVALFAIGSAQAVHELKFQLDGDLTNTAYSAPVGFPTPAFDWNDVFSVSTDTTAGTQAVSVNSTNVGAGKTFGAASFVRDFESGSGCTLSSNSTTFCTADDTTYATGSKDTLGIGNGGWQCNHDANVNSKIDIMNSYITSYTNTSNGHKIFYFGLEKNKSNGTNDVGVWFLQGGASCAAPSGHINFTGGHLDGDTLVVSEFSGGGGVSTVKAFRWAAATSGALAGDGGCIDSHDNPNPATGGCNNLPIASGADCKNSGGTDSLCATTNAKCTTASLPCSLPFNNTVDTNWLTADATLGVGTKIPSPDFFEGGIDITQAFQGQGGTTPSCFTTIVPDTRSSASPTATLFDYVLNQIGSCSTTLTTSAAGTANGTIGSGQVSSGTDTATLTISGTSVWGGTLSWYLCGPVSTDACDKTKGVLVTSTTVSQASSASDFVSGTATLSSVGRYCWTAHFEPNTATKNAGVNGLDDSAANECFNVAAVTPTLSTSASCSASPCIVGSTLSDTATLAGAATGPGTNGTNTNYPSINPSSVPAAGGSINWIAYGPGSCTAVALASTSRAVSGNDTYPKTAAPDSQTAVSFVSAAPGLYVFVASYAGNAPNTNAATPVACSAQPSNEQVTVTGNAHIGSAQRWLPNDTVTLTGDTALTGTLTVTLYPSINCTGTAVPNQAYTFHPSGVASGTTYTTGNTTFFVGTNPDGTAGAAAGSYSWLVHYDDSTLTDPADHCEKSTLSPITD